MSLYAITNVLGQILGPLIARPRPPRPGSTGGLSSGSAHERRQGGRAAEETKTLDFLIVAKRLLCSFEWKNQISPLLATP